MYCLLTVHCAHKTTNRLSQWMTIMCLDIYTIRFGSVDHLLLCYTFAVSLLDCLVLLCVCGSLCIYFNDICSTGYECTCGDIVGVVVTSHSALM